MRLHYLTGQKGRKTSCRMLWGLVLLPMLGAAVPGYCREEPAPSVVSSDRARSADAETIDALLRIVGVLVQTMVDKGLLDREEAVAMLQKSGGKGVAALAETLLGMTGTLNAGRTVKEAKDAPGRRPAVTLYSEQGLRDFEKMTEEASREIRKAVRKQVKNEIKEEVLEETKKEIQASAVPDWAKRIRFGGNIRLRYQGDYFDRANATLASPSDPTQLMNTTDDQQRYKVRARLSATAEVTDKTEVGLRLTTGDASNPVSTNQNMGTYYNKYGTFLDLAYLKVRPVPGLTFIGGRIPNPWFFTDLVWYRELPSMASLAATSGRFQRSWRGL